MWFEFYYVGVLNDGLVTKAVPCFLFYAGVLNGKHYNRAIRMNKLLYKALQRLQLRAFSNSEEGKSDAMRQALLNLQQIVARLRTKCTASKSLALLADVNVDTLSEAFAKFVTKRQSPIFKFW